MIALLRSLVLIGVQYAVAESLLRGNIAKRRLAFILRGMFLFIVAGAVASVAGIFWLLSLFFALAEIAEYVRPALITALVATAVALGVAWEGWRQMKK